MKVCMHPDRDNMPICLRKEDLGCDTCDHNIEPPSPEFVAKVTEALCKSICGEDYKKPTGDSKCELRDDNKICVEVKLAVSRIVNLIIEREKPLLHEAKKEGYEESVSRAIEMAVFDIPYICKFQNTPARLVGIVIPETETEAKR